MCMPMHFVICLLNKYWMIATENTSVKANSRQTDDDAVDNIEWLILAHSLLVVTNWWTNVRRLSKSARLELFGV